MGRKQRQPESIIQSQRRGAAGARPGNNRKKGKTTGTGEHVEPHWAKELEGCDLIINLAGRSVNCRYTRRNRKEILDSRVNATKAIGQAIREATVPPKLWINMASATIYRHAEDRPQDEYNGEMEDDFSVQVCICWGKEPSSVNGRMIHPQNCAANRDHPGRRRSNDAIPTPCQMGDWGGEQGSGKQMCSWVHIDDIGRAIEWFIDHPDLKGSAYNISAPDPVTNARFIEQRTPGNGVRPFGCPRQHGFSNWAPHSFGTETELILKSRWVLPAKLSGPAFAFSHPRLKKALASLINRD